MAQGHGRIGQQAERHLETLGFRHLPASARPRSDRMAHDRDCRDVRRGSLPLGIELSDRKALDRLRRSDHRAPHGGRWAEPNRTRCNFPRYCMPGLPADLKGEDTMGLEIRILDYGDIELESS